MATNSISKENIILRWKAGVEGLALLYAGYENGIWMCQTDTMFVYEHHFVHIKRFKLYIKIFHILKIFEYLKYKIVLGLVGQ